MEKIEKLTIQNKDEFFFHHNYSMLTGGAGIAMGTCLFWMIVNEMRNDARCLHATGTFWVMMLLVAASIGLILFYKNLKKRPEFDDKAVFQWRLSTMIYNLILFTAVAMINGAGNLHNVQMGYDNATIGISLSSVLLFIPVVGAMPAKKCGFVLMGIATVTLFIPFLMPGSEMYNFVPELILRLCLAVSYIVFRKRTESTYELQCNLLNLNHEMDEFNDEVMDLLINAVEIRDTESGEHVKKVRQFTRLLAEELMYECPEYELSLEKIDIITKASAMHDIGKIMIPDDILLKPGKLTEEEFEIMKTHSQKGFELLRQAPKSWGLNLIKYCKEICLYHHEKYDGKGYPAGLIGDEIPIWAQIVSVADCFEALTSDRSYKAPYPPDKAFDMIISGECGAFSDKIITALKHRESDFKRAVD